MQNKRIRKIIEIFSLRNIFLSLGILFVFFIALRPPIDPDMGWHLKDGEYLINHDFKVAKLDIFSYTMPNFPLIMHEWATDILMWILLTKMGMFSLILFFALATASAFVLASFGVSSKKDYKIIAAMLGIIASIPILGVRPQMLSLLGLASVIFIVLKFRKNPESKIIYWLPAVMLLWVNFHGGFAVGLFFIGLFLGIEMGKQILIFVFGKSDRILKLAYHSLPIRLTSGRDDGLRQLADLNRASEKRIAIEKKCASKITACSDWIKKQTISAGAIKKLFLAFVFSFLATLVNPYGWKVYIEVITTIFDKYARSNIGEWLPVLPSNPMSFQFIIYLALLFILLIFSYRKIDYTYLIISGVFCYLGFSSWRHMPVFLIISIPLWVTIVESLVGRELLAVVRKKWFLAILLIITGVVANQRINDSFGNSSVEKIAEVGNYPLGAVEYLKKNPIAGNMFNEYNWGGFLVWQYPEKKTFIDGRMPSWKIKGFSIFEEFEKTMKYDEGWDETFKKYNITFALVYNNLVNEMMFSSIGWKKIYSDSSALIFLQEEGE